MLLSASIGASLFGFLDRGVDHLAIGARPVGRLDEFAALDLKHLDPAAALVSGRCDLEWGNEAAQSETADRFHALFDVIAGRSLAAIGPQGIADRLDMDGGLQQAAVVVHCVFVHALEGFLSFL